MATELNSDRFFIRASHDASGNMEGFFTYAGVSVVAQISKDRELSVHKLTANNTPCKAKLLAGPIEVFDCETPKAPNYKALVKSGKGDRAFEISLWKITDHKKGDTYYAARMQERKLRRGSDFLG